MVSPSLTRAGAFAFVALLLSPSAAFASCDGLLPVTAAEDGHQRPINARDLIELREVGSPDSASFASPTPFAVSPDGTKVAYIINRADLATDSYCRALVVTAIAKPAQPSILDRGGELIKIIDVQQGFYVPTGATEVITPVWSPDGWWIAFLRRDHGRTQVWAAAADGSGAHQISHANVDVTALTWSGDGRLLFGTPGGESKIRRAIDREGDRGWLYDERISPDISARPRLRAPDELDIFAADLRVGSIEPAGPADQALLKAAPLPGRPVDPVAIDANGRRAWVERDASSSMAPAVLTAATAGSGSVRCAASACSGGILSIWWDRGSLLLLRREGWDRETIALYRWTPGPDKPVTIIRTNDILHGCVKAHEELVCTRESSRQPRRVVAIDIRSGKSRLLFDPNPEFAHIQLGQVVHLRWRNKFGMEARGDLVLPAGYRSGERLPMVVVQYHSDGFLRGGTGDEYPIFLLAERGFAVLSTERPALYASQFPNLKSWDAIIAANQKDWAERHSLLSSVLTGVKMAVDQGYADPKRVGISGLSDGSTTVAFALIHSHAFKAAAVSTCCIEPNTTMTYGGIAWADWLRTIGYPSATSNDRTFWRDMSLAQNAANIDTPLLMQLSDKEFRLALEAFSALREQHKPVEMYIFPDEAHVKWQPIHRLAVYERNLDWFSFWLQDKQDPDPAKQAQYTRWRAMRDKDSGAALAP